MLHKMMEPKRFWQREKHLETRQAGVRVGLVGWLCGTPGMGNVIGQEEKSLGRGLLMAGHGVRERCGRRKKESGGGEKEEEEEGGRGEEMKGAGRLLYQDVCVNTIKCAGLAEFKDVGSTPEEQILQAPPSSSSGSLAQWGLSLSEPPQAKHRLPPCLPSQPPRLMTVGPARLGAAGSFEINEEL